MGNDIYINFDASGGTITAATYQNYALDYGEADFKYSKDVNWVSATIDQPGDGTGKIIFTASENTNPTSGRSVDVYAKITLYSGQECNQKIHLCQPNKHQNN